MPSQSRTSGNFVAIIKRYPVVTYFALAFTTSWAGALAVAAPHLARHEPLPKMTGILMFPAMLLGPSFAGIFLTRVVDGTNGLRDLFSRMFRWQVSLRWYAALLIAPVLVLSVLFCLKVMVSPSYAPNRFLVGIFFGVPAGFLEEVGWMGFAFPKLCAQKNALAASILLGLLWSGWHLPVINYLGTATPRGGYWFHFFIAFASAMTAMRVLIGWVYTNTTSVFLAQLIHVSSTGSLVIFSPANATARQEAMWYGFYSVVLWLAATVVIKVYGSRLIRTGIEADSISL
jgi:membrane protease YdiL (CAAX protease family)